MQQKKLWTFWCRRKWNNKNIQTAYYNLDNTILFTTWMVVDILNYQMIDDWNLCAMTNIFWYIRRHVEATQQLGTLIRQFLKFLLKLIWMAYSHMMVITTSHSGCALSVGYRVENLLNIKYVQNYDILDCIAIINQLHCSGSTNKVLEGFGCLLGS